MHYNRANGKCISVGYLQFMLFLHIFSLMNVKFIYVLKPNCE